MKEENLKDVVEQIKGVENGISDMIIPMLKDSIADYKKTFTKMFILVILLILVLSGTIGYSLYLVYKQNVKYEEFLSQFDFSSETVYQDVDSGDGSNSTINDGIKINQLQDEEEYEEE